MRREVEGFWRCPGGDEVWSRLSEVDAIDFKTRNTNESQGYASDSVEVREGVLKSLNRRTTEWVAELDVDKELNMWLCIH